MLRSARGEPVKVRDQRIQYKRDMGRINVLLKEIISVTKLTSNGESLTNLFGLGKELFSSKAF